MTVSFLTLTIFFLFSSFAFGCTENWAITVCEVILFLGAGLASYTDKEFLQWPKKLKIFALFISFLVVLALIQLLPIPVSIWNFLDPSRIEMYENAAKAEELLQSEKYRIDPFEKTEIPYESIRQSPQVPNFLSITRTPVATIRAIIAFLSFFCFLLLLEEVIRQGKNKLKNLALIVGLIGLTIGFIALVEKGIENKTNILWLRESVRAASAFGPFVNANHGAAFVNLTFPILYYLIWRKIKRENNFSEKLGLYLVTLSLLILQIFLIISGFSYGNIFVLVILPICFYFNISFKLNSRLMFLIGAIIFLFIILLSLYFVFQGAFEFETKRNMFQNGLKNCSIMGLGINSFRETFPSLVERWPVIQPYKIEYLENEYLQIFYEGGILAFIFAILVAINVLSKAIKNIFSKTNLFWISIPLIGETIRVGFDMTFHIFPLCGVFALLYSLSLREKN